MTLLPTLAYALAAIIAGVTIGVSYTATATTECFTDLECCTLFDDCGAPLIGGAK